MAGRYRDGRCHFTLYLEWTIERHPHPRLGVDFSRRRDQHFSNLADLGMAWRGDYTLRHWCRADVDVGLAHQHYRRPHRDALPRVRFVSHSFVLPRLEGPHSGDNRRWARPFYSRNLLALFGLWCPRCQPLALDCTCRLRCLRRYLSDHLL